MLSLPGEILADQWLNKEERSAKQLKLFDFSRVEALRERKRGERDRERELRTLHLGQCNKSLFAVQCEILCIKITLP